MLFTLKWIGKNKSFYFNEFTKFIKKKSVNSKMVNYTCYNTNCGTYTDSKPKRFYKSLYIEKWQLDELKDGINKFYNRRDKLHKIGITPKLCIIIEGPAGTGKSSLIRAIASENNGHVTRPDLADLINSTIRCGRFESTDENQEIIMLEDIDYIYRDRTDSDNKDDKSKKNQNDFLQVLDGEESQSNAIYICTTNRYDELDWAIKRRFNIRIQLNGIKEDTAYRMAKELCKIFSVEYDKENIASWIDNNWETHTNYKTGQEEDYINPKKLQDFIIYGK